MDEECMKEASRYVSETYIKQAIDSRKTVSKKFKLLLAQRKIPEHGFDDFEIDLILKEISLMDSNNFHDRCGVGEREGRIYSKLVADRHYRLGHGIGRSGDIAEVQPKAAGSSLLNNITNALVLDAIRLSGGNKVKSCFVVPMATGMSMVLCLLTIKMKRSEAKYVLWPRIDQKSCFKSIYTAGLLPVVIENELVNDELRTNIDEISKQIEIIGAKNIACILSTTSCFAPRTPDKLDEIAKLCKLHDIPHVVNNAYGIQSSKCMSLIEEANRVGRLDAFVQSTDKNFMVPVGGAIIAGYDDEFLNLVRKTYPGRGSSTPTIDVFITLLSLGRTGYSKLLKDRKEVMEYFKQKMMEVAEKCNEKLLFTKNNPISLALSVNNVARQGRRSTTELGAMLFMRRVSGSRVITAGDNKDICGHEFKNWGSHHDNYPHSYLTVAAAVGVSKTDCDIFIKRFEKVYESKNQNVRS